MGVDWVVLVTPRCECVKLPVHNVFVCARTDTWLMHTPEDDPSWRFLQSEGVCANKMVQICSRIHAKIDYRYYFAMLTLTCYVSNLIILPRSSVNCVVEKPVARAQEEKGNYFLPALVVRSPADPVRLTWLLEPEMAHYYTESKLSVVRRRFAW